MRALRIGIDIGGTFTDAALVDGETGAVRVVKVLTTPEDPAKGFMTALERGLAECAAGGRDVAAVVHATTVATNAIIEGKTARVGMLVTRGFRDILEIGRQIRSRLYDVHLQKPAPLVPRRFSLEVGERLDHEGRVLTPLDLDEVRRAARRLRAEGVEAVVVCLLHSYLNPAHERAVAAVLREEVPDAFLSVSSDVCPEFREYLRASTAAVNAAVMPIVSRYVDALESRLHALGAVAPFYVMQSNGGVMTSASAKARPVYAKARPVYMVESGPAAGVIAAGAIAAPYGHRNVMSFDMGGTTAKVGLIQDGRLRLSTEIEVGAQSVTPLGEGRGGGYPIRTPVIDLVEVGAGGGSEAWIDAGGALRVGPRSAGARPGPVCYGRGGTTPTITDANLVLGRLNPAFFLGGEMTLDAEAARRAIADRVATPLSLDALAAAAGIVEIANAHMIGAMRLVSVQRGYDPRDFVLVAFGGAGPLHANALARELGIPTVLVPPTPGIASAVGMLMTDLRHEFVTTRRMRLDTLTPAALETLFEEFLKEGSARPRRRARRQPSDAAQRRPSLSRSIVRAVDHRAPAHVDRRRCRAAARGVRRRPRARVRLRRARGRRGAGQRPPRGDRHDAPPAPRAAARGLARCRRRAQQHARGLVRRGRRLAQDPRVRSDEAAEQQRHHRAGDRRGPRREHARASRMGSRGGPARHPRAATGDIMRRRSSRAAGSL
jgi:N-methylhydantoinase A